MGSYLEPVEFFEGGVAGRFSFCNRPVGTLDVTGKKTDGKPAGSVTEDNRRETGPFHTETSQLVLTWKVFYFTFTMIYYMKLALGVFF
jgi:hypothetical protein